MKERVVRLLSLGVVSFTLVATPTAQATIFNIVNGDVPGLTNAINTANSNGQNDIIELATGGTYTLTTALPELGPDGAHSLIIHGNGSTIQRNPASPNFRIFYLQANANVSLVGLTLTNGNTTGPTFHGGAIYIYGANAVTTLTISGCTFDSNKSDYGGAIFNDGGIDGPGMATLVVTNSTFSNNTGTQYGGGIWSENGASGGSTVLYISNCLFSGNSANRSAGAVQHDGFSGNATGTIISSTFTHNSAGTYGGAINVDGSGGFGAGLNGSATLNIITCTFDQNTANDGGGVALDGSDGTGSTGNALVKVDSCTFSGNLSTVLGDAFYVSQTGTGSTVLQIGNSILASSDPDFNISTDAMNGATVNVISSGYNLSDDAAGGDATTAPGGFLNQTGDQRNTDPMFDPAGLKNNGGLMPTIALQATSPALDQGKSNTIFSGNVIDERGEPKPFDDPTVANAAGGDGTDIGAYEADVRIISSSKVGNDFQITFTSILGRNYEVQTRTSIASMNWNTVNDTTPAPPIAGTGGVVGPVIVPNAFSFSTAFYRLQQLP